MKAQSVRSTRMGKGLRVALWIITILLPVSLAGCASLANIVGGNVLTHALLEPLGEATTARVDINNGSGNLTIDRLDGGEQALASGTLQYFENQGQPARSLDSSNGLANLTLKAASTGFPCNGAIEWQIHLNPAVSTDITAHSDGGNLSLNLAGMKVTRVFADTGGGNVDLTLPEGAADLSVTARTGAGNVVVRIPGGIAARINASSGLGNVVVDSKFTKIDGNTYQSPDYDTAAYKVEITLSSGAGNVNVNNY